MRQKDRRFPRENAGLFYDQSVRAGPFCRVVSYFGTIYKPRGVGITIKRNEEVCDKGRAGDPPRGGLSAYRSTRASSGFIVSAARRIASSAGKASTFGSMTSTEQGPS